MYAIFVNYITKKTRKKNINTVVCTQNMLHQMKTAFLGDIRNYEDIFVN